MKKILVTALLASSSAMASIDFTVTTQRVVEGEYIVKFARDMEDAEHKFAVELMGAEYVRTISPISNSVLIKAENIEAIENSPMLEYAEPNAILTLQTVNDPRYGELWGLQNNSNDGFDVNAEAAWEITTGSEDVIVGVIDTGVDYTHPDLVNNMWVNEAERDGQAGVDDDGNGYVDDVYGYDFANKDGDPMDDNRHGTHCAGTIAAEGNNSVGVVGVAHKAKIMAIKFLSGSGSGSLADAVSSIDYATINGAHLTSNSWGGGGFNQAMVDAIQRANDANILFVAAAGNSNQDNDARASYPATYDVPNVVSVAAMNISGMKASFSSYGRTTVDLAAPGRNILSTVPGGGYESLSGTSMATPHVSGAVVLLLAQELGLKAQEIRDRLVRTARPNANFRGLVASNGMLDAESLLTDYQYPPDPNDPSNWDQVDYNLSSIHPYENNMSEVFEITRPEGAEQFAIYFDRFELESGYDFVIFEDENGNELARWTGIRNGQLSPAFSQEKVILRMTSDGSVTDYGFDVTALAVK